MRQAAVWVAGLYFGEGPRWHDGRLWLSDFYAHAVLAVDPGGRVERIVAVPGQPSGLGWLPDGRLLVVSMTDRRLLRLEADGLVEHADLSAVATWHCNDMVVDAHGRAYVGNFGGDLEAAWPAGTVFPTAALARVDPDGAIHVAATDLRFPNGTVITPDGATLIIAESGGQRLTAFDVAADGALTNRRLWAALDGVGPDGICLDAAGAILVANARASECLRVAEGGAILDRVATSQRCYACMLGGPNRTTLFMLTAPTSRSRDAAAVPGGRIERAEVEVPGAGLP